MRETRITGAVTTPETEFSLELPANTVRLELRSPSNFPIRVSLVQGDVLEDKEGWVIDLSNFRVIELERIDGPLYFASAEPGPILDVIARSTL